MAVTLKFRRGTAAPTAALFDAGEPAWDAANSKLYLKNNAGSMICINPVANPADDAAVVHIAGTETITGAKTFSQTVTVPSLTSSLSTLDINVSPISVRITGGSILGSGDAVVRATAAIGSYAVFEGQALNGVGLSSVSGAVVLAPARTSRVQITTTNVNFTGNNTAGSADTLLTLNTSGNATNSGSALRFNHFNGSTTVPSGRIGFRRSSTASNGEMFVELGSGGSLTSPLMTLSAAGQLTFTSGVVNSGPIVSNQRLGVQGGINLTPITRNWDSGYAVRQLGVDSFLSTYPISSSAFAIEASYQSTGTYNDIVVRTSNANRLTVKAGGNVLLGDIADDGTNRLQVSGRSIFTGTSAATTETVTTVKSAAGFSGYLTEWQTSGGSRVASVSVGGELFGSTLKLGGNADAIISSALTGVSMNVVTNLSLKLAASGEIQFREYWADTPLAKIDTAAKQTTFYGPNTSGSRDSLLVLSNTANASGSGAGIRFDHYDGTSQVPSGRIGFRRWASNATMGEMFIEIGSAGALGAPVMRLDVNGKLSTTTLTAANRIDAGDASGNPIGMAYGGDQGLRHGFWANDHLDMYVRTSFTDHSTIDYMGQWGLGFTNRTGIAGRLHAKATNASTSAIVAQGVTSQTAPLFQALQVGGAVAASISNAGAMTLGDGTTTAGSLVIKSNGEDLLTVSNTDFGTMSLLADGIHAQGIIFQTRNPVSGLPRIATTQPYFPLEFNSNLVINGSATVTDEAYSAAWDGSTQVPTKNAIYDKIQSVSSTPGTAAGSNTQIQFNNSGVLGASSNLTWNGSQLTVTGNLATSGDLYLTGASKSIGFPNSAFISESGGALLLRASQVIAFNSSMSARAAFQGRGYTVYNDSGVKTYEVDVAGKTLITSEADQSLVVGASGTVSGYAQSNMIVAKSSATGSEVNTFHGTTTSASSRAAVTVSNSSTGWDQSFLQMAVHGTGYVPTNYLSVSNAGMAILLAQGTDLSRLAIGAHANIPVNFFNNNTIRMTLDTSGDLVLTGSISQGANGNHHMGHGRAISWSAGGNSFNSACSIIGNVGNYIGSTASHWTHSGRLNINATDDGSTVLNVLGPAKISGTGLSTNMAVITDPVNPTVPAFKISPSVGSRRLFIGDASNSWYSLNLSGAGRIESCPSIEGADGLTLFSTVASHAITRSGAGVYYNATGPGSGHVWTTSSSYVGVGSASVRMVLNESGRLLLNATDDGTSHLQVGGSAHITGSIRMDTGSNHYFNIINGGSAYAPYIELWKPAGTRIGYIGYRTDGIVTTIEDGKFVVNESGADRISVGGAVITLTGKTQLSVNDTPAIEFSGSGNTITRTAANGAITFQSQDFNGAGWIFSNAGATMGGIATVPVAIKLAASQAGDAFQVRDYANAVKFSVSPVGNVVMGTLSATGSQHFINSATAGGQCDLVFTDAGVSKWAIYKQADNKLGLYSYAAGQHMTFNTDLSTDMYGKLTVRRNSPGTSVDTLRVNNDGTGAGTGAQIDFYLGGSRYGRVESIAADPTYGNLLNLSPGGAVNLRVAGDGTVYMPNGLKFDTSTWARISCTTSPIKYESSSSGVQHTFINPIGSSAAGPVVNIDTGSSGLATNGELLRFTGTSGQTLAKVDGAGKFVLGSFPAITLAPLNIAADGAGVGATIAINNSDYFQLLSGGLLKGIRGIGPLPLHVSSPTVKILSDNLVEFKLTNESKFTPIMASIGHFYADAYLPDGSTFNTGPALVIGSAVGATPSTGAAYNIRRDMATGLLTLKGVQSGFVGYDFQDSAGVSFLKFSEGSAYYDLNRPFTAFRFSNSSVGTCYFGWTPGGYGVYGDDTSSIMYRAGYYNTFQAGIGNIFRSGWNVFGNMADNRKFFLKPADDVDSMAEIRASNYSDLGDLRLRNLSVTGTISFSSFASSAYYMANGSNQTPMNIELSRTLSGTPGATVELGTFDLGSGAHNLRIAVTCSLSANSVAKSYVIASQYSQTSGNWLIVNPISSSGSYGGEDFVLEANQAASSITFRVRKLSGSIGGTIQARVEYTGGTTATWTSSTATSTSSVTAPLQSTPILATNGAVGINRAFLDGSSAALQVNGWTTIRHATGGSPATAIRIWDTTSGVGSGSRIEFYANESSPQNLANVKTVATGYAAGNLVVESAGAVKFRNIGDTVHQSVQVGDVAAYSAMNMGLLGSQNIRMGLSSIYPTLMFENGGTRYTFDTYGDELRLARDNTTIVMTAGSTTGFTMSTSSNMLGRFNASSANSAVYVNTNAGSGNVYYGLQADYATKWLWGWQRSDGALVYYNANAAALVASLSQAGDFKAAKLGTGAMDLGSLLDIQGTNSTTYASSSGLGMPGVSGSIYNLDSTVGSYAQLVFANRGSGAGYIRILSECRGMNNSDLVIGNQGVERLRMTSAGLASFQGTALFKTLAATDVPLTVEGSSGGQTANLTNWGSGAPLAYVDASGGIRSTYDFRGTAIRTIDESSTFTVGKSYRTLIQTNNANTILFDGGVNQSTYLRSYSSAYPVMIADNGGATQFGGNVSCSALTATSYKVSGGGTVGHVLTCTNVDGTLALQAPSGSGGSGVTDGNKGDITVSSSGTVWTINNSAVSLAKIANIATATFLGRNTVASGVVEELSISTAKTMLGLTGTNSGDQTITLTGDITGSGTSSFAATIATNAVTFAKMQQIATASILGRATAGTGNIEALTASATLTLIGGQAADTDLTNLAAMATSGIAVRNNTGSAWLTRTLTAGSSKISIGNGDGVSANPTVDVVEGNLTIANISGSLPTTKMPALTGDVTTSAGFVATTIANNVVTFAKMQQITASSILGRATAGTGNIESLTGSQALTIIGAQTADTDLTNLAALTTSGIAVRNNTGSAWLTRTLTAGSSKISIGNGDGVSANPTVDVVEGNLTIANISGSLPTTKMPALTGDITTTAGFVATTIATNAVTFAKMQQIATSSILGRSTAGIGNIEALSGSQALTIIGAQTADTDLTNLAALATSGIAVRNNTGSAWVTRTLTAGSSKISIGNGDGVSANPTVDVVEGNLTIANIGGSLPTTKLPALTGDVGTSAGFAVTTIANDAVTNAKAANMATETIKGRATAGTGDPEDLTPKQARKILRRAKFPITTTSGTYTLDITNGLYQTVTLTGNWTLGFPTVTPEEGETVFIYVKQPASGGPCTVTLDTGFQAPGGRSTIVASTTANAVDRYELFFDSATTATVTITKDIKA